MVLPDLSCCLHFWLFLQGDVEDDEMIPDRDEDIRPRFHKSRTHTHKHTENGEEGGDDDDGLDDDSSLSDWNLSKSQGTSKVLVADYQPRINLCMKCILVSNKRKILCRIYLSVTEPL